jgi:hypothetical protein
MTKKPENQPKKPGAGGADPELMNTFKKSQPVRKVEFKPSTRKGK